jgi:hypothetical protein
MLQLSNAPVSNVPVLRFASFVVYAFLAGSALAAPRAAPPPLGNLVDVGGYRVHLYCTGAGSPTVFIVGGFSFDWNLVQPKVAEFAKVCTYDVSGTAWSDFGPL